MRIGVHSGEAVVGNIGSPGRVNYTIVGDSVNIGARLEQLCKIVSPGADVAALISGATAAALDSSFSYTSVGGHTLRGRGVETEAFRLI